MDTLTAQWHYLIKQWQDTLEGRDILSNHEKSELLNGFYLDARSRGVPPSKDAWDALVKKAKAGTQAAPVPPNPAENLPDADEPLLKNLRCLEDIIERGAEISKKVLQLGGGADKGGVRNVLLEKLNRRLAYIQTHRIERADLPQATPPQQPQVTVHRRVEEPRITAIRERIDREWAGYTGFAGKIREKLHRTLDELIREPERQVFRDRSRGSIEVHRGLNAVELIMNEKIRSADSPFGM